MSNEKVILSFLNREKAQTQLRDIVNGVYVYKGRTLQTNGDRLINYNTIIAFWEDNKLHIDTHKYSSTTSHIQSKLKRLAEEMGVEIIEYNS